MILSVNEITEHLRANLNLASYQPHINRNVYFLDGISLKINYDQISDNLKEKIQKNFNEAERIINLKLDFIKPSSGDFILVNNKYYRIAIWHDENKFQYTEGGSFHLSKSGLCSYSGGFDFTYGSTFNVDDFKLTTKFKKGSFWICGNDEVKAHNGVYFDMDFKVWKFKGVAKKQE